MLAELQRRSAVRFRGAGDDHEVLVRGAAIFDGLYAVLKPKT
jgi:hypothetical protein